MSAFSFLSGQRSTALLLALLLCISRRLSMDLRHAALPPVAVDAYVSLFPRALERTRLSGQPLGCGLRYAQLARHKMVSFTARKFRLPVGSHQLKKRLLFLNIRRMKRNLCHFRTRPFNRGRCSPSIGASESAPRPPPTPTPPFPLATAKSLPPLASH